MARAALAREKPTASHFVSYCGQVVTLKANHRNYFTDAAFLLPLTNMLTAAAYQHTKVVQNAAVTLDTPPRGSITDAPKNLLRLEAQMRASYVQPSNHSYLPDVSLR